jgi:hypothetical protein
MYFLALAVLPRVTQLYSRPTRSGSGGVSADPEKSWVTHGSMSALCPAPMAALPNPPLDPAAQLRAAIAPSAADLKFLHHLRQARLGASNRKAALES